MKECCEEGYSREESEEMKIEKGSNKEARGKWNEGVL